MTETLQPSEGKEKLSKRILVAEDDPQIGSMLVKMLSLKGYKVDLVTNGQLLLDQLYAVKYDLVITDNDMGSGMKGLEAIEKIRADGRFTDLPIILNSGDLTDPKIQKVAERFNAKTFVKGNNIKGLFGIVEEIFQKPKE